MRKFFTKLSFLVKNNRRAARNGADTKPFDFVQKFFAKSSFRLNFCHPVFSREFFRQEQKDVRQHMEIYHLCSKTLQMNQTILLRFRNLKQKASHFH